MAELDLGQASNWDEGEYHGKVKLVSNDVRPGSGEQNVAVISPNSVEIRMNSNFSSSQEMDKVYFTTHHGSTKKVVGILDSDGNLYIAGKVITDQKDLSL
ncbi:MULTISPECIES: DUF6342 family protein [unclassified Streptomyces]|uniref:DUF6342 family protein n=1 Tax=unclassified Streptomyces TaxID=2593676 RepID=UPI00166028C6|nr:MULTISPECIES: DUF6342 family protein [unclassified Streptomyces]MBD0712049.1 hypothetical protein [Streptomyces sp. CBMA291]MBD0717966.1 hypothetical protein [Streptomyces sp. CBMA370]